MANLRSLEESLCAEVEVRPRIAENYNQLAQKYWVKFVESDQKDLDLHRKMVEYEMMALGEYKVAVICEMLLDDYFNGGEGQRNAR